MEQSQSGAEPTDPFLPANLSGPDDEAKAQEAPVAQDAPAAEVSADSPSLAEQTPSESSVPSGVRRDVRALEAQLLGGERSLHRREVAASAGVSLLSARKIWRALGFPNLGDADKAFTPNDEVALRSIIDLVRAGKLTEDAAISLTRAVGQMTDRIVVWQVEAMVEDLVAQRGLSDAQARQELVATLPDLVEPLQDLLVYAWRRQLAAGVQRMAVRAQSGLAASEEGRDGDEDDAPLPLARAVGFADLVSYTALSRRMNEKTLAQLVQRFENTCAEIISVGGGRLIKTIGDEVLYTAETPVAGAEISLALAQAFNDDELLPQARVSMVWGRILSRLGDIYGPTVNLAARLTVLAEPGTVLVDDVTAASLADDDRFVLRSLPEQHIRGFGDVNPHLLSRGRGTGLVLD